MDRTTAREEIKKRLADYLEAIGQPKKNNNYICPICNSGGGNNGNYTTAFKITPNGEAWHCFSCGEKGDIYNLIALQYGKDIKKDFAEILNIAAEALGVVLDNADNTQYTHYTQHTQKAQPKPEPKPEPKRTIDYSDFLRTCKEAVKGTGYYRARGLNDESIEHFNLGLITEEILAQYKTPCHLEQFRAGDLVIPYNGEYSYFIGRNPNIKPNEKGEFKHKKPKTEHAGKEPIFYEAELDRQSEEPIFITEAPLDAISIAQAGGAAVAIGGTGQDKIEAALDKRPGFNRVFIIAFDNPKQDTAGQTATEKLKASLENRGIKYTFFKFADSVKDANAFLMADERGFYRAVAESITEAKKEIAAEQTPPAEEIKAYNAESGAARLKGFIDGIKDSINTPPTATGFNSLDCILDGGLYEGLYILGAVSSLGKTTLLLQIADQIAKGGRDVLIFSLEMAAAELMAKSISRETFFICKEKGTGTANAKTVRGILDYSRYKNYSKEEIDTINTAILNYKKYAGNIFINEGIGNIGIEQIKRKIADHKKARGKTPVIIIDYLQILAPYSERASDKQNTDKAVLELKRIARDEKTPVVAISSYNRGNYSAGANMAAFKESGAIEYSSDVLIALQPCGMKDGEKDSDKAANAETMNKCKASTERNIEAVILKNRNGQTGTTAQFKYNAMFNCFEEITEDIEFIEVKEDYNPWA